MDQPKMWFYFPLGRCCWGMLGFAVEGELLAGLSGDFSPVWWLCGALGREIPAALGFGGCWALQQFGDLMNELRKWGFCAAPTQFGVSEICGVKQHLRGGQSPCESTESRAGLEFHCLGHSGLPHFLKQNTSGNLSSHFSFLARGLVFFLLPFQKKTPQLNLLKYTQRMWKVKRKGDVLVNSWFCSCNNYDFVPKKGIQSHFSCILWNAGGKFPQILVLGACCSLPAENVLGTGLCDSGVTFSLHQLKNDFVAMKFIFLLFFPCKPSPSGAVFHLQGGRWSTWLSSLIILPLGKHFPWEQSGSWAIKSGKKPDGKFLGLLLPMSVSATTSGRCSSFPDFIWGSCL